jgi:hypothetical protein
MIEISQALAPDSDKGEEAIRGKPVSPWISCSERMPEDEHHVLVLCDNGHIIYDLVDKDTGDFLNTPKIPEQASIGGYFATHWMEIPEPPKDGS